MDPRANHSWEHSENRPGAPQNWCMSNSSVRRVSRQVESNLPPADKFISRLSDWLNISRSDISRMIVGNSPQLTASAIRELLPSRPTGITMKISVDVRNPVKDVTTIQRNVGFTSAGYEEPTLEALDEQWQIYLTILYTLTAVASFVLNFLTVLVLVRGHKCMLKRYIINLSMSDLLMSLLSIPFTYTEYMLGRWIFPKFLCPLVRFAVLLSVFVSAATMTVIGINRYIAIMNPTRESRLEIKISHWRLREAHLIASIWIVGIAISTPEYLMNRCEPFCFKDKVYYDCSSKWPDDISLPYSLFVYLVTFAIPVLLLVYVYTRMGFKIWRHRTPGNADANRDMTIQTTKIKVIKMFFVVVALFVISWSPIQTFYVVSLLLPKIRENIGFKTLVYNIYVGCYFFFHWLSMFHSCLNPIIYCFMSGNFRRDLYKLICKDGNGETRDLHQSTYSASYGRINNTSRLSLQQDQRSRQGAASACAILSGSASSRATQLDHRHSVQLSSSFPGGASCRVTLKHLVPLDAEEAVDQAAKGGEWRPACRAKRDSSETLHHLPSLLSESQTSLALSVAGQEQRQVTETLCSQIDERQCSEFRLKETLPEKLRIGVTEGGNRIVTGFEVEYASDETQV